MSLPQHLPRLRRWRALGALAIAFGLVGGAATAHAYDSTEPTSDLAPWEFNANNIGAVFFAPVGSSVGGAVDIHGSTDVDNLVVGCVQRPNSPAEYLTTVSITFTHAVGDLDMAVYTLGDLFAPGQYVASSEGITNEETVTIPGNQSTALLKVWGYRGATGPYSIHFRCRN